MSIKPAIGAIAAATLLAACSPESPHYFTAQLAWFPRGSDPTAINSVAFVARPPAPGQPGYLDTVRFINDGVKYIDPHAEFFVSFDGELCFRGLVNRQQATFENYQNYWCMPPAAINHVDAIENNISYVNSVRLWCRHAAPQCARRFGPPNFLEDPNPVSNSIWAQIVPYRQGRDAIDYLVYLMGGDTLGTQALRR